jgi:hypothetical protein
MRFLVKKNKKPDLESLYAAEKKAVAAYKLLIESNNKKKSCSFSLKLNKDICDYCQLSKHYNLLEEVNYCIVFSKNQIEFAFSHLYEFYKQKDFLEKIISKIRKVINEFIENRVSSYCGF